MKKELSDYTVGDKIYLYYISENRLCAIELIIISVGYIKDTILSCSVDGLNYSFKLTNELELFVVNSDGTPSNEEYVIYNSFSGFLPVELFEGLGDKYDIRDYE